MRRRRVTQRLRPFPAEDFDAPRELFDAPLRAPLPPPLAPPFVAEAAREAARPRPCAKLPRPRDPRRRAPSSSHASPSWSQTCSHSAPPCSRTSSRAAPCRLLSPPHAAPSCPPNPSPVLQSCRPSPRGARLGRRRADDRDGARGRLHRRVPAPRRSRPPPDDARRRLHHVAPDLLRLSSTPSASVLPRCHLHLLGRELLAVSIERKTEADSKVQNS